MVAYELDEISPEMENLEISDALLKLDEYSEARKSLIEGKALGSEGFASEVLKYCDLDNNILCVILENIKHMDYANKLLVGEKPNQWSKSEHLWWLLLSLATCSGARKGRKTPCLIYTAQGRQH